MSSTASVPSAQQLPEPIQGTIIGETLRRGEKIVVMDFFCGAGGMSSGAIRVLEGVADAMDVDVEEIAIFIAVNHWDLAIETHAKNHPWVTHIQYDVTELRPNDLYEMDDVPLEKGDTVHAMIACPDCTHFSNARGGGPKDPDSRATPREILDFVERLDVRNILFENVPKFEDWGPLHDDTNQPIKSKEGEYFDTWIKQLTIEGFAVEWRVLNAADYGDATSRKRLFVIGRKDSGVSWPEQTHSENGEVPRTEPWRTAADILDLDDPGESIFTRDLHDGRVTPPALNTNKRIAEGLRRHGVGLEPYADVIEEFGPEDIKALRKRIVPAEYAGLVAQTIAEPFLVKYYGTSTSRTIREPLDTVTSGGQKFALCTPYLLGQQSNARARAVDDDPLPTIACRGAISKVETETFVLPKNGLKGGLHSNAPYQPDDQGIHTIVSGRADQGYLITPQLIHYSHGGSVRDITESVPTIATERGGAFSMASPYLVPFYSERKSQAPRTHALDDPHPTIPSSAIKRGLVSPFLVEYYGNGRAQPITSPVPTIPTKDRFALVVPEMFPLGIDVLFRMLKPSELAAAMGFDPDYEFVGNKGETVAQIGNAVPVNLAESLCDELLLGESPTLDSFVDGATGGAEADD